jgi:hypothetical protein
MNVTLAVTAPAATHAIVLAQQPNGDNGGQGEDFGKSSPVGFLLLLIFLIAVALLVRSMTKHLKRVPASFDPHEESPGEETSSGAETGEPEPAGTAEAKEKSESSG